MEHRVYCKEHSSNTWTVQPVAHLMLWDAAKIQKSAHRRSILSHQVWCRIHVGSKNCGSRVRAPELREATSFHCGLRARGGSSANPIWERPGSPCLPQLRSHRTALFCCLSRCCTGARVRKRGSFVFLQSFGICLSLAFALPFAYF